MCTFFLLLLLFFYKYWDSQELCVNPTMDTICYSPWTGSSPSIPSVVCVRMCTDERGYDFTWC